MRLRDAPRAALSRLGRQSSRPAGAPILAAAHLLTAFADAYPAATFVEIGANDGDQHDPLRDLILGRAWTGVMVEPVPEVFDRLRGNYAHLDRVHLENVAIAERDGSMPFFHLAAVQDPEREGLPRWYDGIGSFSREAVLGHREHIPDIDRRLVSREVPCLSFESLCRRHGIDQVDLLLIDTEGYDLELLRSIDLATHRPRLIGYEHFHLTAHDREIGRDYVQELGYETMEEGFDTWCLDPRPGDALCALWSTLRPAVAGVAADRPRS